MLTKFSAFFNRWATGWNVLIFLALQILFNVGVFPYFQAYDAAGNALPVMDLMFGFDKETAYHTLESYGQEGRDKMLFIGRLIDSIYPFVYTMLDILAITFLFRKFLPATSKLHLLNLLPFFAFVFDFIENYFLGKLITTYPNLSDTTVRMASLFNQLKWIAAALCIFFILCGLIGWMVRGRKKPEPQS
jgi:hypothetical protein